jgi:hypothetical protein
MMEFERRNASTLRTVMVNLFVLFNVSLLVGYMFFGDRLTPTSAYTLAATYLSLAAFIIYIVRTSHFRSGVLLSLRENARNQGLLAQFLETRTAPLTDADVDVARLLMTNRSEREKQASHPYELLLKNVQGTNIQFRGGKMQIGAPATSRRRAPKENEE